MDVIQGVYGVVLIIADVNNKKTTTEIMTKVSFITFLYNNLSLWSRKKDVQFSSQVTIIDVRRSSTYIQKIYALDAPNSVYFESGRDEWVIGK